MTPRFALAFRVLVLFLSLSCLAGGPAASPTKPSIGSAPEVLKVEPPGWWAGHSINPVRLLIRGHNLSGAKVTAQGAGVRADQASVNAAGTYLFVDATIDMSAKPGRRSLRIATANGSAEAVFEVRAPVSRTGRFQGFSPDDLIYELMPDRFAHGDPSNGNPPQSLGLLDRTKPRYYHGGNFQGVIDHLPYLKELGVTALWITPVYANVNHLNQLEKYDGQAITDYHGYGAVDFYAVEEHFGTMTKLQELVDDAHRLGIKVIQDEVANHTGPYNPWVTDPPTPTWFHGTEANHPDETWQIWTLMSPHATPALQKSTVDGWFINILPDLNQDDAEVARYLIQNTLWWIGMAGFDAIREDTLPYVPRRFWHDWMTAIKREYPHVTVVGEVFDGDPALVSFFQGGVKRFDGVDSRVDSVFDFPLLYPIRRAFGEGKSLREVAVTLAHDYLYPRPDLLVTFLGNHDVPRFMNELGSSIAGLKLALTLLLTTRGIPMIYSGDEIAMPGGGDPDNRRDFPGGWPGDARNAFAASGRTADEQAIFEHVRRLAQLRAELEPLRRGALADLVVGEQTYAYARVTKDASVITIINNDTKPTTIKCDAGSAWLGNGVTLSDRLGVGPDLKVDKGEIVVTLPARSASIYVPEH